MNLNDLKKEVPCKWKVNSYNSAKNKGMCVAYIDSRSAQDILDEVVGSENWKDRYYEVCGNLFCEVSIFLNEKWVSKTDCGTESMTEGKKGMASDAFKRACVKWGVGRFLYDKEMKWIDIENKKPIDRNGETIWNLTDHFSKKVNPIIPPKKVLKPKFNRKVFDGFKKHIEKNGFQKDHDYMADIKLKYSIGSADEKLVTTYLTSING